MAGVTGSEDKGTSGEPGVNMAEVILRDGMAEGGAAEDIEDRKVTCGTKYRHPSHIMVSSASQNRKIPSGRSVIAETDRQARSLPV